MAMAALLAECPRHGRLSLERVLHRVASDGYTYELLGRADQAHVAARFMVAHWPFPGLCNPDEVEYVLMGYDDLSEWPEGSGTSFLAHFAPVAFAQGARLAPSRDTVWR